MQIARPGQIWPSGEKYDLPVSIGDIVQVYAKTGGHGFNAIWVRVSDITSCGMVGDVIDGPQEVKGKTLRFSRGNVFDVI